MTKQLLLEFLKQNNISPEHILGQNFLLDEIIMQDMVDASNVSKTDDVLEIGPGIGTLTKFLIKKAKSVFAVEKDKQFTTILKQLKHDHNNFDFVIHDIRDFDINQQFKESKSFRVVANIPYYITGTLLQILMSAQPKPKSLTLMVQKEVALNLVAKPGKLNLLGISVQLYAHPKLIMHVPADKFFPKPEVSSSIVHIEFPNHPPYKIGDEEKLFRLLKIAFSGKRKQLHNSLLSKLKISKQQFHNMLDELSINHLARPQELTIGQWIKLSEKLELTSKK